MATDNLNDKQDHVNAELLSLAIQALGVDVDEGSVKEACQVLGSLAARGFGVSAEEVAQFLSMPVGLVDWHPNKFASQGLVHQEADQFCLIDRVAVMIRAHEKYPYGALQALFVLGGRATAEEIASKMRAPVGRVREILTILLNDGAVVRDGSYFDAMKPVRS